VPVPAGPDIEFFAPSEDLADPVRRQNPARRRPTLEHPALDLYAGSDGFLVRTALIRSERYRAGTGPVIRTSDDICRLVQHLAHADQEHFVVLAVSNQNRLMAIHESSVGGTSKTLVELRHAIKVPFLVGAQAIAVVHNHPSGDPTPSPDDIDLTKRLKEAVDCVGLTFLDHVIVSTGGCVSFHDRYGW
jgi:DNA repair protein RadC